VLGYVSRSQRHVELDDALESLGLAEARLRIEPDLVLGPNLGSLAGLEIDERPGKLALIDEMEHLSVAGRGQRPFEHRGASSPRRPEGDNACDRRDQSQCGGEAKRRATSSPQRVPIDLGIAEDTIPVARAASR
jgi:hypothetical protein